jgi:hypothetical protein
MLKQIDPRTPDYCLTQGDTARPIEYQLTDCCGNPVDLTVSTGVTLNLRLKGSSSTVPTTRLACQFISRAAGTIRYVFTTGQTNTPGDYLFNFTVVWPGGSRDSYPNDNYSNLLLRITPQL